MVQESIGHSVTHPSNLASPSEDDRGELMVSGQRARNDVELFREQLDSGLGEQWGQHHQVVKCLSSKCQHFKFLACMQGTFILCLKKIILFGFT